MARKIIVILLLAFCVLGVAAPAFPFNPFRWDQWGAWLRFLLGWAMMAQGIPADTCGYYLMP